MSKKAGFTLIELLVVIAIIAILAAILFPVFARARERARAISCLSNMKEFALAIQMYLADNGGVFPIVVTDGYTEPDGGGSWFTAEEGPNIHTALMPYVENAYELMVCPSDKNPRPDPPYHLNSYAGGMHASWHWLQGVYGIHYINCDHWPDEWKYPPAHINVVKSPTSMIILTDVHRGWTMENFSGMGGDHFCPMDHPDAKRTSATGPWVNPYYNPKWPHNFRHNHVGNFAFADGHAEALRDTLMCTSFGMTGAGREWCTEAVHRYTFNYPAPWVPGDPWYADALQPIKDGSSTFIFWGLY
jgi:prepilin-type N-terminal cleavage/methylation domain-containing protein/prepilin-type processing-associated H-X9-DG protein